MSKAQAAVYPDVRPLNGAERVAVLLLALGRPKAASLLKRFDADEIRSIARAASDLPAVSAADLAALVEDFARLFSEGIRFVGSAGEVKGLLSGIMSEEEIAAILSGGGEAPASEEPVWTSISRLKDEAVRKYLEAEHPQTAAWVLTRLQPGIAAAILRGLPADLRHSVLSRMLGIRKVADDAAEALERALKEDVAALSQSGSAAHAGIADILNRLDKPQFDLALKALAAARPAEARALRALLFTFEDLPSLPAQSLALLFSQIPIDRLVLGLSGTDAAFQATVLAQLATRARRMVESELQSGSQPSARDVADARRAIVDAVLKLVAAGQIELPAASAETGA